MKAKAPFPYVAAAKGLTEAIKPLQADLFVLRGKTKPRGKRTPPMDYELHINPLGIGLFAVGSAAALWLMQLRVGFEEVAAGKWVWPDGTPASKDIEESKKGDAPKRERAATSSDTMGSIVAQHIAGVVNPIQYEYAYWLPGDKLVVGSKQRIL